MRAKNDSRPISCSSRGAAPLLLRYSCLACESCVRTIESYLGARAAGSYARLTAGCLCFCFASYVVRAAPHRATSVPLVRCHRPRAYEVVRYPCARRLSERLYAQTPSYYIDRHTRDWIARTIVRSRWPFVRLYDRVHHSLTQRRCRRRCRERSIIHDEFQMIHSEFVWGAR